MLERRPFGKTGIEISRLALGGLPLCTNWGGEGVETQGSGFDGIGVPVDADECAGGQPLQYL